MELHREHENVHDICNNFSIVTSVFVEYTAVILGSVQIKPYLNMPQNSGSRLGKAS